METQKQKRVLVIDPESQTITESFVSSLEDMQTIVGGRIERAATSRDGHDLFVNEEFLLGDPTEKHFFGLPDRSLPLPLPYAGKAFIIGPVDIWGNSTSAAMSVSEAQKTLVWLTQKEAMLCAALATALHRPSESRKPARPNLSIVHGGSSVIH